MGSDRARVTYDPRQQYRSVVMQQGRVTLEADWNEAEAIAAEELRHEMRDIIGPCGTPDNGYQITLPNPATSYDFSVGSGTMYVGGIRAELPETIDYGSQPDWINTSNWPDPDDLSDDSVLWVSPTAPASAYSPGRTGYKRSSDEFVYLYLREQEVSAVEDPDLADVALGGPDTAARTRLLQHIVRVACRGTDCLSGLTAAEAQWASLGLDFDAGTMRLKSQDALLVSFSNQEQSTPCQPQAQGGYLDPDNQLIRVQIAGVDPITGNPTFLWGFDNASFLYRISVTSDAPVTLKLASAPVDTNHQPVSGQTVEILRAAAELANGGYVAALSGFTVTLNKGYNQDTRSITLPDGISLQPEYLEPTLSPPATLFLRVWQNQVVFTPGVPIALGDTGVMVTLETGQTFHVGDYWQFAVRPATPQKVYPERYQLSPQPPAGPRIWVCPLGVIARSGREATLASDCRVQFCNLTGLSKRLQGCCQITVGPQDLASGKTLQSYVNQASRPTMVVYAANPGAPGNNITVEIANIQMNASPPTFDLIVTEIDTYTGLTVVAGSTGIESVIGDERGGSNDGLAHIVAGSVNSKVAPGNQSVVFSGGVDETNATANIVDGSSQNLAFTLEARNAGIEGNLTEATVFNLDHTAKPPTFDLSVAWTKTAQGVTMATLLSTIEDIFGYAITASLPSTAPSSFPAAGVTRLQGGTESDAATGTSATVAQAAIFGDPVKICLKPGNYTLSQPITLGPEQSNITIEACNGASLVAQSQKSAQFVTGMFQINGANNVILRGLTFVMPVITVFQQGSTLAGLSGAALEGIGEGLLLSLVGSVGLMVSGCGGLTVDGCSFAYPAMQIHEIFFAAGIFAGSDCTDLRITGNSFMGPAAVSTLSGSAGNSLSYALTAGYMQADSFNATATAAAEDDTNLAGATIVPSSLDNIVFSGNNFKNLTFPVMIATALGRASFENNVVASCVTGFTLLPLIASLAGQSEYAANDVRALALNNPTVQRAMTIATAYPRPASFQAPRRVVLYAGSVSATSPASPGSVTATNSVGASANLASKINLTAIRQISLAPATAAAVTKPMSTDASATATKRASSRTQKVKASAAASHAATESNAVVTAKLATQQPLTAGVASLLARVPVSDIGVISRAPNLNLSFSVQFSNNNIDAFVTGGLSLWALMVVDVAAIESSLGGSPGPNRGTTYGVLTLTSNRMRNVGSYFTASLMVQASTVTGNLIANANVKPANSLQIYVPGGASSTENTALSAITGNILTSGLQLPPRTSTSLPAWATYNNVR